MTKKRLLIISDDPCTREELSRTFAESEFLTFAEPTTMQVIFQLCFLQPHLVILEMGRNRDVGWRVLQGIREWSLVPVIAVLPPGDAMYTVEVLNAGADQCLADSFVLQELQARVRALLRRMEGTIGTNMQVTSVPAL